MAIESFVVHDSMTPGPKEQERAPGPSHGSHGTSPRCGNDFGEHGKTFKKQPKTGKKRLLDGFGWWLLIDFGWFKGVKTHCQFDHQEKGAETRSLRSIKEM